MTTGADSFRLLGLPMSASPTEVRAAFRLRAATAHHGTGQPTPEVVALRQARDLALTHALATPCPTCGGSGQVTYVDGFTVLRMPCGPCAGDGRRWR